MFQLMTQLMILFHATCINNHTLFKFLCMHDRQHHHVWHHWWWFCRERFHSLSRSLWSLQWWHRILFSWTKNHSQEWNTCNNLHGQHHRCNPQQAIVPHSFRLLSFLLSYQTVKPTHMSHSQRPPYQQKYKNLVWPSHGSTSSHSARHPPPRFW